MVLIKSSGYSGIFRWLHLLGLLIFQRIALLEMQVPATEFITTSSKATPPGPGDFVSQYDKNRRRAENNVIRGYASLCETMGLSTFTDINDAVDCFHHYPMLGDKIARLTLGREAGKVKATPRYSGESHHTWWKNQDFDPISIVEIVVHRWPIV